MPDLAREPDTLSLNSGNGHVSCVRACPGSWRFQTTEVTFHPDRQGIGLRVSSPDLALFELRLSWRAKIQPESSILGDHWERGYGDLGWQNIRVGKPLPWYFLLTNAEETLGIGVATGCAAFCHWTIGPDEISLHLDLRSGGVGVRLGQRNLSVAHLRTKIATPEEPLFEFARRFSSSLCDTPLLPDYPVYGANDWYYSYGSSSREQILADSEMLSDLCENRGNRPFSVIDDGWQSSGTDVGSHWRRSNSRFADLPGLAAEMKELGTRPGIWYRPLLAADQVDSRITLPFRQPLVAPGQSILNPALPEVLERVREDIATLVSWGFQLIKHDFTSYDLFGKWGNQMGNSVTDSGWSFNDDSMTSAEVVIRLYDTVLEAAGGAIILGCNTFGHLCAGRVHVQRIGDDTSGREWSRTRQMGINTLAFRAHQHGTFFQADADCVGITDAIPWELNRQWLELVACSGTPLFVSARAQSLSSSELSDLKRAFSHASQAQKLAEPLDWLEEGCPRRWNLNGRIVEFNWDSSLVETLT